MRQFDRYGEITNYSALPTTYMHDCVDIIDEFGAGAEHGYRPRACERKRRTIYAHIDDVLSASLKVKHAANLVRNLFISWLESNLYFRAQVVKETLALWYFAVSFLSLFFPVIE
jgi:hypothetical protein